MLEEVLAISQTSKYTCFAIIPSSLVVSHKVVALCIPSTYIGFGVLSCSLHQAWAQLNGSTLEDRLVYSTEDCFGSFPLPKGFDWSIQKRDSRLESLATKVEKAARAFWSARRIIMVSRGIGMTEFYNMFHSPECELKEVREARLLFTELDSIILEFYGFSPLGGFSYGFAPEYLEFTGEELIDPCLKDELVSSNHFFISTGDAVDFNLKWQACVKKSASLPWRYRWPDAVRDDVLARLLALNAERYAEEVAQGLHCKGGNKASGTAAAAGKRRGRPAKAADPADTEQIGLAL
jgi:hypothetical protein